jgi:predicted ArsR family transcriptional regulator
LLGYPYQPQFTTIISVENKEPFGPRPTPATGTYAPLSRQRLGVLEYLRIHAPIRIAETATDLGLHANTVREHLDALVGLGIVERIAEKPVGRGRPAAVYRPSAADPAVVARDYAGLATALAGHLARTSSEPESDARAAGVEWGRELAKDNPGGTDSADARRTVLDMLARLGFGPDDNGLDDPRGIALRYCPLLDAARRYPSVVCQVHLGIVAGLLEQVGADTAPGLDLIAFAEPGACRLFLPDPVVRHGS